MSLIGKISGKDWSAAPTSTTHIKINGNTYGSAFRSIDESGIYAWDDEYDYWKWRWVCKNPDSLSDYTSKEEDLGLNKIEGKTVDDIEVGMFLRCNTHNGDIYFVRKILSELIEKNLDILNTSTAFSSALSFPSSRNGFNHRNWSYSYSYNGPYTPFTVIEKETEQEKKIKELQATINEAKKQIDELSRGKV